MAPPIIYHASDERDEGRVAWLHQLYNASDERGEAIGACPHQIMLLQAVGGLEEEVHRSTDDNMQGMWELKKEVHRSTTDDIKRVMRQIRWRKCFIAQLMV